MSSAIATHLLENGVSEQTANRIQTLLNKDEPFHDCINHLKGFTKAKTEVSDVLIYANKKLSFCFVLGIKIIEKYRGRIRNHRQLRTLFWCNSSCML